MRDLPAGTVTFLFTDVEGSTRLVQELRDEWPAIHAEHRRILREAFGEHGGREVDSQGDSFLFAFARARDAVAGAAAAQRALATHQWSEGAQIRVRMGLHTGEPDMSEEGYLGVDLARAARICAAGHGGQVLLSSVTRGLVDEDALDGVAVIDRGDHRLKDLKRPERLYQLVLAGLQSDLRPLRTEEKETAEPALPAVSRRSHLERAAEDAFRDLRATIEESVAASLRGAHEARTQARAQTRLGEVRAPPERRSTTLWHTVFMPVAIVAIVFAVPVVWLLTR